MATKNQIKYGLAELERDYGSLTLAKLLLAYREGEGLGPENMAKVLGISEQELGKLEQGRKIPPPKMAAEIAQKLGMLPESLIALAIQDDLRKYRLDYKVSLTKVKKKKVT